MQTDTEGMPEYVTINHASKLLGCSTSQVRRMIEVGALTTTLVSKHLVEVRRGLPLKLKAIKLADLIIYEREQRDRERQAKDLDHL